MADSIPTFVKRLERMKSQVQRDMATAVVQGGTVIELRAKEILTQKGHVVTGNLRRNITTQLGKVTKTFAEALVGTHVIYGKKVEFLPIGPRRSNPNRGEGGGYLQPATVERLAAAIQVAGKAMEEALRRGSK